MDFGCKVFTHLRFEGVNKLSFGCLLYVLIACQSAMPAVRASHRGSRNDHLAIGQEIWGLHHLAQIVVTGIDPAWIRHRVGSILVQVATWGSTACCWDVPLGYNRAMDFDGAFAWRRPGPETLRKHSKP